jgi:hypothetical protein
VPVKADIEEAFFIKKCVKFYQEIRQAQVVPVSAGSSGLQATQP